MKMNSTQAMVLVSIVFLIGCNNKPSASSGIEQPLATATIQLKQQQVVIPIDITKSTIKWRGTKLMGTGYHEGTVKFSMGELVFLGTEIVGGTFTVDMKSIYNTDIPLSDPVPRINITTHLNSDFETVQFPIATFTIKTTTKLTSSQLEIAGVMTIKGISKVMTVNATELQPRNKYTASFSFDRHNWKIGESGSWLEQKVVDSDVAVQIELFMANQ